MQAAVASELEAKTLAPTPMAMKLNTVSFLLGKNCMYINNQVTLQNAPPLMPAVVNGGHHIKWTPLADLPVPMWNLYAAVRDTDVYVAGGDSPIREAKHHVYHYSLSNDQWSQLPPPNHYYGIPHIIGNRLAIIGGRLSNTKERTNKVSTFDDVTQTWISFYPNMLSVRNRPGVVSHLEYTIVAGGGKGEDAPIIQDDIEILNWVENSHWRKLSITLPEVMSTFIPTIIDDHLFIVGYTDGNLSRNNNAYKISLVDVMASIDQGNNQVCGTAKWSKMPPTKHWFTALVPSLSPLLVVGGWEKDGTATTADINMYEYSEQSWKKVGTMTFARSLVAVAMISDNAIIVIGGYTKGGSIDNANSSTVTTVALGQAEMLSQA